MWHSDGDFLNDLDQMDEIYSAVIQNDTKRKEIQDKQTGNRTRHQPEMRGRLYSFSDEDEQEAESGFVVNNTDDHFGMLSEVGRQITLATGNVYNNDILTKYWRQSQEKSSTKHKEKEENPKPEENKKEEEIRGRTLVFEPKFNFKQPKQENMAVPNTSPTKAKSKKKESVALAISNSVKSLKLNHEPKIKPNVTENISEIKENISKINCRFSLPITRNTYNDFYTGRNIEPPNLIKHEENLNLQGWNHEEISTWADNFQGNSDDASESTVSSYITAESSDCIEKTSKQGYAKKLSNDQNNKHIDVNSEIEFPPL